MKRVLSLFLAIVMLALAVPVLALSVAATESGSDAYVVYQEDFESLATNDSKAAILQKLGWYVTELYRDGDMSDLTAVGDDTDMALHISTRQPVGMENDTVITILNSDVMALVREGNFTLSYDLTYRGGTTNANGFASVLYNFNEKINTKVVDGDVATYGLVALRPCGTGMNGVFYPINTMSRFVNVENVANTATHVLANRYNEKGAYSSLAGKLGLAEDADTVRAGSLALIDTTITVTLEYVYEQGVNVYANGILVSTVITQDINDEFNTETWEDFVTRTTGSALALMVKPNIEVEIDDILVTTDSIDTARQTEMPELLITEICAAAAKDSANNASWAEYIELYNPGTEPVDLSEYSILFAANVFEGYTDGILTDNRYTQLVTDPYDNSFNLGDYIGKPVISNTAYYLTVDQLSTYAGRYVFYSNGSEHDDGLRYRKTGTTTYELNPNGAYCKVRFVERWNERYQKYNEDGTLNEDIATNTMLAPGECMLIFMMHDATEIVWKGGVNAGMNDTNAYSSATSFRKYYMNSRLDMDTKIVGVNAFNLANDNQRYYYLAKTYGEDGTMITTKSLRADTKDQIVSYVEYLAPVVAGTVVEGAAALNPSDAKTFGATAVLQEGYSAVYVYGVDSNDAKRGTLYTNLNATNHARKSSVGSLTGYQILLFEQLYRKKSGEVPELMITEIVPRTNNLLGEDISAFTAIELTNTSDTTLNLYRYSLVSTEMGTECSPEFGFTRYAEMKAGNPVNKGNYNGAYYYFVNDHISNPETCYLAPGETVVVWFITEDTYTCYSKDSEFGVDYFRQYWANNGNESLALRAPNGEYATKVIAVDGLVSETLNNDNFTTAFQPSPSGSALYGVALASGISALKDADPTASIKPSVVNNTLVSTAFFGNAAVYYDLKPIEFTSGDGVVYLVNSLSFTKTPANLGMRYTVGTTPIAACSAMARVMKTQYYSHSGANFVVMAPGARTSWMIRTATALVEPDLGRLGGKEIYHFRSDYLTEVEDGANTVYYINDASRLNVRTLHGAAIAAKTSTAQLRFDAVLPSAYYASVVAASGAENVKVGALIVETEAIEGVKEITPEALTAASIAYTDVEATLLYSDGPFTVVGAYYTVDPSKYETDYTAIHYITYTLKDGTTVTLWSGTSTEENVVSAAQAALDDVQDTRSAVYAYSNGDGKYSRYSPELQAKLRAFIGA